MDLTPKQEKFCQGIVSGMSGKDSYLAAYNSKSDNAAMIESTKLLKREDITKRISELRKPIETLAITNSIKEREKIKDILWNEYINNSAVSEQNRLRAIDILNRMNSEYININKDISEEKQSISALSITDLKSLVEKE